MACNAFQRPGRPESCSSNEITAYAYAGSTSQPLPHITTAAQTSQLGGNESNVDGVYFPNDMEAASIYFNKGLYDNRVATTLSSDGSDLKIGIRATLMDSFYWCIFDNFRLYCHGKIDSDKVNEFEFMMGDVNADGHVSVADFTAMVQYILGGNPQVFIHRAANLNDDNIITVADLTDLVNIILH